MYIPKCFEETDLSTLHEFIVNHSFATLVSRAETEPFASHLPLLLDRDSNSCGTLIGHMARANPQWEQAREQNVLAIFHGPHAYISPAWLDEDNAVPTWNYIAVHVYGRFQLETNRDRLLEIVEQTVRFYEADASEPWTLENAEPDFIDGLLDAITGFRIVIDRIEGKSKLSQNHNESRRNLVIRGLQNLNGENQQQLARLMSESSGAD